MSESNTPSARIKMPASHPFRRAVLRGLGIAMPPLLTIVIFVWVFGTLNSYLLSPVESWLRQGLHVAASYDSIYEKLPEENPEDYVALPGGQYVPISHYEEVRRSLAGKEMPTAASDFYEAYVETHYWILRPYVIIPVFVLLIVLVMYLLGKFMAAGAGRFFYGFLEAMIRRLPLVRNVYSSVKQVTDFVFTESEIEYTRVVAIEYPRRGIWSFGLVTGESMLDIRGAANEPVLSVLMPTSPMPVTGFTVTIKKSEAVDLDITIDQAFQFIISCGVVVPQHQLQTALNMRKIEGESAGADQDGNEPEGSPAASGEPA